MSKLSLTYLQTHTLCQYRPWSQQEYFYAKSVETLEAVLLPSVSNNAILHGVANCPKCITQMYYSKSAKYAQIPLLTTEDFLHWKTSFQDDTKSNFSSYYLFLIHCRLPSICFKYCVLWVTLENNQGSLKENIMQCLVHEAASVPGVCRGAQKSVNQLVK